MSKRPRSTSVFDSEMNLNDSIKNKEIFSLKLSITNACNLRCKYCFVNKKADIMDVDTAFKAIDLLLFSKGKKNINNLWRRNAIASILGKNYSLC